MCSLLNQVLHSARIRPATRESENALGMMNAALIQAGTRSSGQSASLSKDTLEQDPERLSEVEQRLFDIYDTARKHRMLPEDPHFLLANQLMQSWPLCRAEKKVSIS